MDGLLGATGTGLGLSNWITAQELKKNELKLKALVGEQVVQTDAYLQEGLQEERETIQDIHTIASTLSILNHRYKDAFNTVQKELYCAQFASIKYQGISQILEQILAGKVPTSLFTEEVMMKWFGLKDCFNTTSGNLEVFMNMLGKCKLPLLYSYLLQMARISSHPLPAGFYSPLDYGPLMEGINLPFTRNGGRPSKPSNRTPPIQILRWWNETVINNPQDKSWACSAGNSFDRFGCFMRQMYAMLLTVSVPIFQSEQVFERLMKVESLGVLQENVLKERKDLPKFITQLKSGEWRSLDTECCEHTPFGFACECDAMGKQPLCGTPQSDYVACDVQLTHLHNNFTKVVVLDNQACITTTHDHFSVFTHGNETICPINSTSFCITPNSTWSVGNYQFPYVNTSQQNLYVDAEEQLGYVEEIPEFKYDLPQLDSMLMSLMQRKDSHIVKMQKELEDKDKGLISQMHDGDMGIALSGWLWEITFKAAICLCIILIVLQSLMLYCLCYVLKQQIAKTSRITLDRSRWI